MRIKQTIIENFRGIDSLVINANGKDVTVTGQNGTGKTSVYMAYLFVLGHNFKGINRYGVDSPAIVELTLDDDVILRREFSKTTSPQNKYSVNGKPVDKNIYDRFIHPNIELFSNVAYFPTMPAKERRNILLSMCSVSNADVLATNDTFAEVYDRIELHGTTELEKSLKQETKTLKAKLDGIPYELKGLQFATDENLGDKVQLTEQLSTVQNNLSAVSKEITTLQEKSADTRQLEKLNSDSLRLQVNIENIQSQLQKLRDKYKELAQSSPGTCPTCGQRVPIENFISARNKRIAKINEEGKKLNETSKKYQLELQNLQAEIQKCKGRSISCDNGQLLAQAFQKKLLLERELSNVSHNLELIREFDHRQARIAELHKAQTQYEDSILELTNQVQLVKDFQRTKCKLVEEQINSKFHFVKFKLFDYYVTTGEVKDCCEVLLDDKPYGEALSKGEKLKAGLDCLKTLQEHFEVQLPVFIDDFESYTDNSLILSELPNQLFKLKVSEGVTNLKVEVI